MDSNLFAFTILSTKCKHAFTGLAATQSGPSAEEWKNLKIANIPRPLKMSTTASVSRRKIPPFVQKCGLTHVKICNCTESL